MDAAAPDLPALLLDPARVQDLPPEVARDLLLRLAPLQEALRLRALAARAEGDGEADPPAQPDRWLTAEEAARLLNVTPAWLYRHHKRLPFARKLSRKVLRFSEAGLRRWQATKRA